jgi:hypothetical protein
MKTTHHRTAALVGDGVNSNAGAFAQFEVTIVVHAVLLVQAEEPMRSRTASTRSAHLDQRDPYQLYRRVFVPGFQLLREQLPEPQV